MKEAANCGGVSRLYPVQWSNCRPDLYQCSPVQRGCATLEPFRSGKTCAGNPSPCALLEDIAPHTAGSALWRLCSPRTRSFSTSIPKKRIQFPLRVQNRPGCGAVGQTIGH